MRTVFETKRKGVGRFWLQIQSYGLETRSIGKWNCETRIKCETLKMKRCATKCMSEGFELSAGLVIWDLSKQD